MRANSHSFLFLFDAKGNKVSSADLRSNANVEKSGQVNTWLALAILGLVMLAAIAVAVFFVNWSRGKGCQLYKQLGPENHDDSE
jgi:hypothetical protein